MPIHVHTQKRDKSVNKSAHQEPPANKRQADRASGGGGLPEDIFKVCH
jgi:hypothetical protein